MKHTTSKLRLIFICALLIPLILDAKTAVTAGSDALQMCIRSVIPGVLPFILLGNAIASEIGGYRLPFAEKILQIPQGTAGYFLIGIFCGYPVGAKLLNDAAQRGQINKLEASRMTAFCNNASPAFIIGILSCIFTPSGAAMLMWIIQICASVITGMLLPPVSGMDHSPIILPTKTNKNIMTDSLKAIASICGWIIVFSVILAYLSKSFLQRLDPITVTIIRGTTELTNGLLTLSTIRSASTQYIISAILLSIGGICVLMQTKSVAPKLNVRYYIYARLLHGVISATLASFSAFFIFGERFEAITTVPLLLCASFLLIMIYIFNKKMVAIRLMV